MKDYLVKKSWDDNDESRIDTNTASGESRLSRDSFAHTIVFEVHVQPDNEIVTSRFMCGRDRSRVQTAGDTIINELCKRYGFLHDDLVLLSSDESDGIWVWVRSRVPIPPKRLTATSSSAPAGSIRNSHYPELPSSRRSVDPDVIDI